MAGIVETFKAQTIAHYLANNLARRLAVASAVTEGFDASGFPTISIVPADDNTWAAGDDACFIRVRPVTWSGASAVDGVGLQQAVYTPHVIDVLTEANTTATSMGIVSPAFAGALLGECMIRGSAVNFFQAANGVPPASIAAAVTDCAIANVLYTWADLENPLTNQI